MTRSEERFRRAVRGLLERGTYPGPTAINRALGRTRKHRNLDGRECRWRESEFLRAGWTYVGIYRTGQRSWAKEAR